MIAKITAGGVGIPDLWEASPIRIDDNDSHTEAWIDMMFPGDPLLCCGWSNDQFDTRPRSAWRGQLNKMQFVVPSPMSAIEGVTQEGKRSKHTLQNTGPRRFLVVEFDSGELDSQAARLFHLGCYAPLVLAMHSGSKSLHGWFLVANHEEEKVRKFFDYAVECGADPMMWTRSQFARVPDGVRDDGRRQTVYYASAHPLQSHE